MAQLAERIASSAFQGAAGESEHFICIDAPHGASFAEQLACIEARYAETQDALGLSPDSAVFRRIFLSDVMNQAPLIRGSALADTSGDPVAVSMVQQAPLPGAKIALFAYHIDGGAPLVKRRLSPKHMLVERSGLNQLWSTRLCAGADASAASAGAQTRVVFEDLIAALASQGSTLRDHCVRTWVYLKDVDVFYQDMVESRGELFLREGLTRDTHYIASTGIEGACAHRHDLVAMDAYSVLGLAPEQISYLNDFDRLCATKDYGVTFERGTAVAYADRAHLFISGTASIDRTGQVVHPGDVLRQLDRALDNVEALLRAGAASLDDMMHLTVYLRDPADFARIDRAIAERLPDLPVVIVQGAVCRPAWLVEVEGVAIVANDDPALPAF